VTNEEVGSNEEVEEVEEVGSEEVAEEVGSDSTFVEVSRQNPATTNGQAHFREGVSAGEGNPL
jgi:hypothetical protein